VSADPYPDIPLLRKAVEWVEEQDALPADEREWNQRNWFTSEAMERESLQRQVVPIGCGTKACVCGRLAIQNGAEVALLPYGGLEIDGQPPTRYGARVLGITNSEATDLFYFENTAADVRRHAEAIAARVGERL
jgi:hypothetical protein